MITVQDLLDTQRRMLDVMTGMGGQKDLTGRVIPEVLPETVSMDAALVQEQAFTTAASTYRFDFTPNSPAATAVLNNVRMGQNDVFGAYAIEMLLGYGANANNRVYRHRGVTPDDESIYAGELTIKYESQEPVLKMNTRQFKSVGLDPTTFNPYGGWQFITPFRIVTGYLAVHEVIITLPSIAALTLSSDLFISLRFHGAISRPK